MQSICAPMLQLYNSDSSINSTSGILEESLASSITLTSPHQLQKRPDMAKSKNPKLRIKSNQSSKLLNLPKFKSTSKSTTSKKQFNLKSTSTPHPPPQTSQSTTPPIHPLDKILLIGEGDFSFAASLVADHGASLVLASTNDSQESCLEKYPSTASSNIALLQEAYDEAFSDFQTALPDGPVLFSVDGTTNLLKKSKAIRRAAPFDVIVFNFPHVGGLSTDVNRQVRANQALLVAFFTSAKELLRTSDSPQSFHSDDEERGPARILVTLFEGEPYSLWNVRDLARSVGLVVRRSWRFDASVYPRYRHARTGGAVRKGDGDVSESAWKGEERAARTYEFGIPEEVASQSTKRRAGESSEDEDED